MSAYTLILGENYLVYMILAVAAGVVSALVFTDKFASADVSSPSALQVSALKAAALAAFLFVMWRESDNLFDALVKASFPIGVYTITKTLVSLLIAWRASHSVAPYSDEMINNG